MRTIAEIKRTCGSCRTTAPLQSRLSSRSASSVVGGGGVGVVVVGGGVVDAVVIASVATTSHAINPEKENFPLLVISRFHPSSSCGATLHFLDRQRRKLRERMMFITVFFYG